MSEPNDPFEARLRRLVGDAAEDAPTPPSVQEMMQMPRPNDDRRPEHRRWIAGGAIGLVAAAVLALLVLPGSDDDAIQPVDTPPTAPVTIESTVPTPTTTASTSSAPTTGAPTTTASPSTTSPDTTSTSQPLPDGRSARTAIDLADASVFGLSYGAPAEPDVVITDLEPALGAPTSDSGWQPTPTSFDPNYDACFGPRFRTIWWGDFRITFGEFEGDAVRVAAWTVGTPGSDTSAPVGDIPESRPPSGVAADGAGVGASRADVLAVVPQDGRQIGDLEDAVIVTGAILTRFDIDADDAVVGIGSGRLDCTAGA